jgi:hypothetical protein
MQTAQNHKGQKCIYSSRFCQEGYCICCEIAEVFAGAGQLHVAPTACEHQDSQHYNSHTSAKPVVKHASIYNLID